MKITALVENQSSGKLKAAHGLSLHIETGSHNILFDVGPDGVLLENAKRAGIDLSAVDTVILSHGHADHGGALAQFLQINNTARIYAQRKAFDPHYSKLLYWKVGIGIAGGLREHPQVVLLDGDHEIDAELKLFTVANTAKYHSTANDTLYTDAGRDDFAHEQNLMILGDPSVLVMGCGHAGVVNILEKAAAYQPKVCVGGFHLFNPTSRRTVPTQLLDGIAGELAKRQIQYYTCHCTGKRAFDHLRGKVANMRYLACGDRIELGG